MLVERKNKKMKKLRRVYFKLRNAITTQKNSPSKIVSYMNLNGTKKIEVIKKGDKIILFVPSLNNRDRYIAYSYLKETVPAKNLDQWRQKMCAVYKKIGDKYLLEFSLAKSDTEWEGAIEEEGAQDFIGGFHGDEFNEHLQIVIDGKRMDSHKDFYLSCDNVEIINKSKVNLCNSETKAFTRYKISRWNINEYSIENKWIAEIPMKIRQSKLCMASLDIKNNGKNILKWGRINNDITTDISKPFTGKGVAVKRSNVKKIELWGDTSYFHFTLECKYDRSKYPNHNAYIEDFTSQGRVKAYFDLTGNYNIVPGEEIECTSILKFNI